jgi:predicted transport protein
VPLAPGYISPHSPTERKFRSAKELEELIFKNSKTLFGQQTIMVALQKKDGALFGNHFVPSGFLIDVSDLARPRFYIIDILHEKHHFYGDVFPRVTKSCFFLNGDKSIEKLCELLSKEKEVKKGLQDKMKPADIPLFLKASIISRAFVLLVMDNELKELPEFMESNPNNWKEVKLLLFQKFGSNGSSFCTLKPSFSELHINGKKKRGDNPPVTEEYHFEGVSEEVKENYNKIKSELLKVNKQLEFNPKTYYISLRKDKNLAFFHVGKKKISLVVMNPEKETRKVIKHHVIKTLTEKVQKFWNGTCCTIVIENATHLNEVIVLLKKMVAV